MRGRYMLLGAGPGIGMSTALRFASEGFDVTLVARNESRLAEYAIELQRHSQADVQTVVCDLADLEQLGRLLSGRRTDLEVLHLNAASVRVQDFILQESDSLDLDIRVGLSSALIALQHAPTILSGAEYGTVLVTGGILGVQPRADLITLGAVKAGLRNVIQALSPGFITKNIHLALLTIATAVKPGSKEAREIGDLFWRIHEEAKTSWAWEYHYPLNSRLEQSK